MADESLPELSLRLKVCLTRLRDGDASARDDLIAVAWPRLETMTHAMLSNFKQLRLRTEAEDILPNVFLRMQRALEQVTPDSEEQFFGLAALQIRRELIDLSRAYPARDEPPPEPGPELPDLGVLSPEERQLFDLLMIQQITQEQVAALLNLDQSTVKRRWRKVKVKLAEYLQPWQSDS